MLENAVQIHLRSLCGPEIEQGYTAVPGRQKCNRPVAAVCIAYMASQVLHEDHMQSYQTRRKTHGARCPITMHAISTAVNSSKPR